MGLNGASGLPNLGRRLYLPAGCARASHLNSHSPLPIGACGATLEVCPPPPLPLALQFSSRTSAFGPWVPSISKPLLWTSGRHPLPLSAVPILFPFSFSVLFYSMRNYLNMKLIEYYSNCRNHFSFKNKVSFKLELRLLEHFYYFILNNITVFRTPSRMPLKMYLCNVLSYFLITLMIP